MLRRISYYTPLLFIKEGVGGMSSIWHLIELTLPPKADPPMAENPSLEKSGIYMIFFLLCHK